MSAKVVVIGGGGAGLCAAIAAREEGCDVFLVSKTPVGYGNCTAYSGGAFSLGILGVEPSRHRDVTLEVGRFINEIHMLDGLSYGAPEEVPRLSSYGVPIELSKGRASVARTARSPLMGGEPLTKALREHAEKIGVKLLEGVLAVSVRRVGDRPVSVAALNSRTGELFEIPSSAVVVATGGAGQAYGRTDNPVKTTGDGYRLLFDLRVGLQDMEFVQFYPLGFAAEGTAPWYIDLKVIDDVPLLNSEGEPFLNRKLKEWGIESGARANTVARDRCAIAVALERARGSRVFLHAQELRPEGWDELPWLRVRCGIPPGLWPPRDPIEVAPTQHYFCGGATVGPSGETEAPGVFACGEVTGGMDGANRVGGNALSGVVVFGFRAGRAAAEFARSRRGEEEHCPSSSFPDLSGSGRDVDARTVLEARKEIKAIADEHLGPVREERGLRAALAKLAEILPRTSPKGALRPRDLVSAFETQNLWLSAYAVASSALTREESRGVHFRTEFPEESSEWRKVRIGFVKDGDRGVDARCIKTARRE